jgi:hypothetical protein
MLSKQTSEEALAVSLRTQRMILPPGTNWNKQANHIAARNVLHTELGMFSDDLPIYHLDQDTRDRLLVHARQDAAEALCHTSSLMDEVHKLKSALRGINLTLWLLLAVYLVSMWSRSGFVLPWVK